MNALIDARPEWADKDTFEADRQKLLQYSLPRYPSQIAPARSPLILSSRTLAGSSFRS
jgi:hypothetical protein